MSDPQKVSYLPAVTRLLPQSSEAERALLGSILLLPKTLDLCAEKGIRPSTFHIPAHRSIYEKLLEFQTAKKAIDLVTLTQAFIDAGTLDAIGGPAFIAELFITVPTAANASYYAEIIQDKFINRTIITTSTEIAANGYDATDTNELLEKSTAAFYALSKIRDGSGKIVVPSMKENFFEVMDRIQLIAADMLPSGLTTGLTDLNQKLGGLHNGEVVIVSGTTGGGKTSLAHNIAAHVAIDLKKPVLIWSYEMKRLWVTTRIIAARGNIDTENLRRGTLTEREMESFVNVGHILAEAPITIEDDADTTLDEMRRRSRQWKAETNGALIVVDYLQKIPHNRKSRDSRQREVAEISDGIQKMAMELDVPVIALCQLNKDGRMREAEDIGFDAKTVLKICQHRGDEPCEPEDEPVHCGRDIVIVKNNNGGLGFVHVCFMKNYVKFIDMVRFEPDPQQELLPNRKKSR